MNGFRDLYTHFIWVGGRTMQESLNLLVVVGGKEHQIKQDYFEFKLSGFWKIDHEDHIYHPQRRWELLNDDPADIEETYGAFLCWKCGREMRKSKSHYSNNVIQCNSCYTSLSLPAGVVATLAV
jgi:hypothetical protein